MSTPDPMSTPDWTDEDAVFMHLVQAHGLGQWQAHGDPVLMHNALHAMPGVSDHTHEEAGG